MKTSDIIVIVLFVIAIILIILINIIMVKLQNTKDKKAYTVKNKESKTNSDGLACDNIIYIRDYKHKSKNNR